MPKADYTRFESARQLGDVIFSHKRAISAFFINDEEFFPLMFLLKSYEFLYFVV